GSGKSSNQKRLDIPIPSITIPNIPSSVKSAVRKNMMDIYVTSPNIKLMYAMPTFNDFHKNIRKEIEFYRGKMNKKLINKVKQSNNINQTKFTIVNNCLSMIVSAKPKITDRNKEFWSLTEKLLFFTSDFCYYLDDNLVEIVIELHNRLKNMPDTSCKGEELYLPSLQDLILEKYVDYAQYMVKSKSDWKFLEICLGHKAANIEDFCFWCSIKKKQNGIKTYDWTISKCMENLNINYYKIYGHKNKHLFSMISLTHWVSDELHVILQITDRLWLLLLSEISAKNNSKICTIISQEMLQIHVHFNWQKDPNTKMWTSPS
ncbi:5723_t:CDS:2, partial [Gigaspora margarita]